MPFLEVVGTLLYSFDTDAEPLPGQRYLISIKNHSRNGDGIDGFELQGPIGLPGLPNLAIFQGEPVQALPYGHGSLNLELQFLRHFGLGLELLLELGIIAK